MRIVYSENHRLHFPQGEIYGGELVTPFERPSRIEYILRRLKEAGLTDIIPPAELDRRALATIHDARFLEFLQTAWREWTANGNRGELIPTSFPVRGMRQRIPDNVEGKAGYYTFAIETAIAAGTWHAALSSAAVALTAGSHIAGGARTAFALCRPPGHHAHRDLYGGYCFLNNAALAAQGFIAAGAKRVAILDVDFHHGNGTQDIFYKRKDVLFCSLHGQPQDAFPYFLGFADEIGHGEGEGFNFNYPMPPGTAYAKWRVGLDDALRRIRDYGPDVVVVSLGVDTHKDDPISFFKLESDDFTDYGRRIAELDLPTLFVMEGGYAIEAIGINVVNVLTGFLEK
jgi:acetoin utilization deacetylase AcuC-like enzyme